MRGLKIQAGGNSSGVPLYPSGSSVSGSNFTPIDLAGLALWLKADAITGLVNGDPVATWVDSSINGNDATQSTPAAQPTYQTNEINSLPCVKFDGSDGMMSVTEAALKPFTKFAVVNITNTAIFRTILSSTTAGACQWRIEQTSGLQNFLSQSTANIASSSTGVSTGSWLQLAISYSAIGEYAFYLNGVLDGAGTNNVAFSSAQTAIGSQSGDGTAEQWLGDIAELIVYDTVLSAGDRSLVEGYITTKYGL